MVAYNNERGPKSCRNCDAPATEYLGRAAQGPAGKTHLYLCADCHADRKATISGKPEKPKVVESTPKPTRVDTFTQGYSEPKYTQGSLFDE